MRYEWIHVLRGLRRRPGFVSAFVLTLALGLGANAAIFGLVHGILLRPLPFRAPDRIVSLWSNGKERTRQPFSIPDLADYQQRNRTFEAIGAMGSWGANLTGSGDPERLAGLWMTPGFLNLLGAEVELGRPPAPDEERAGAPHVAVLSHGLWLRRYAGQASILGRPIILNGESYTVIGVLPGAFALPGREVDVMTPLFIDSDSRRLARGAEFMRPIGRLKQGVTILQGQEDLSAVAEHLAAEHPDTNANKTAVSLTTLHEEVVGRVSVMLMTLQGAALLVLVLVGVNLSSLMLARVSERSHELAIRAALGAARSALVRLVVMENILLASAGAALGLLVAGSILRLVLAFGPQDLPRKQEVGLDGTMVFLSIALALITGVLCGVLPALRVTRGGAQAALREGGRSGVGPSGVRGRRFMVATEFALSFVLLAGAVLLIQSLIRLQEVAPGWRSENLLTMRLSLPRSRYGNTESLATFSDRLIPRLHEIAGVSDVAAVSILPLNEWRATVNFTIPGHPQPLEGTSPEAQYRMVSVSYFKTLGIPRLRGRDFSPGDGPHSAPVVVINDALARRFFPNVNPVGRLISMDDGGLPARAVEIVGVVGDVKHYGLDSPPTFDVYVPIPQVPQPVAIWLANNLSFAVRTVSDPLTLASAVRRELRDVDGEIPASSVRSMDETLAASLAPRRFSLFLLDGFAAFALLLAMIGIYAVTAHSVGQRTRELSLRLALGARREQLLSLVITQGLKPVAFGLSLGLIASLASVRMARTLLFGIDPGDPFTLSAVAGFLLIVAFAAILLPGRRALSIAPTIALRSE